MMIPRPFRWLGRISIRIMGLNMLLLFLMAAVLLSLDTYESQLLKSLEHALVQQGRFLAAALEASEQDLGTFSNAFLHQLNRRQEARVRVIDQSGRLTADSSLLDLPPVEPDLVSDQKWISSVASRIVPENEYTEIASELPKKTASQDTLFYRLFTAPSRIYRKLFIIPTAYSSAETVFADGNYLNGQEVVDALKGKYGSATRISAGGQISVTLYSAIPVRRNDEVVGAVLTNQSTYRILRDLYNLRLDLIQIMIIASVFALSVSFIISLTITGPLHKIGKRAGRIGKSRKLLREGFPHTKRYDEVGVLSRGLTHLSFSLDNHITYIENFAADVSHEFKNPLASIRSAVETSMDVDEPEQRNRFLSAAIKSVNRLEKLISGVRDLTKIEAESQDESLESVELTSVLQGICETWNKLSPAVSVDFSYAKQHSEVSALMKANPGRLVQVFDNLIGNAVSFSPENGMVKVRLEQDCHQGRTAWHITVADQGPGIPEEHKVRIFERFFSYRPDHTSNHDHHSGLGLAICKSIIERHHGTIKVDNNSPNGSIFSVKFYRR